MYFPMVHSRQVIITRDEGRCLAFGREVVFYNRYGYVLRDKVCEHVNHRGPWFQILDGLGGELCVELVLFVKLWRVFGEEVPHTGLVDGDY